VLVQALAVYCTMWCTTSQYLIQKRKRLLAVAFAVSFACARPKRGGCQRLFTPLCHGKQLTATFRAFFTMSAAAAVMLSICSLRLSKVNLFMTCGETAQDNLDYSGVVLLKLTLSPLQHLSSLRTHQCAPSDHEQVCFVSPEG
jgi:hypothetical protein